MFNEHGQPTVSRRAFLATAAMTGSSIAAGVSIANDRKATYIDAHSHIWSREIDKFPLANGTKLDDLAPPSFNVNELWKVAQTNGVGKVVLIQHHTFHGWDNRYLVDAARRFPDRFRVVGMVDNFSDSPGKQMRRLHDQHVTGLRITPRIYEGKWLGGGMDDMWRTAADTGQNMCCLIDAKHLTEIDAMCRRHPQTPVVIDHFARIGVDGMIRDADVTALCQLAKHKHVRVKLSAYYALGTKRPPYDDLVPMIRRVLDAYSPTRCMWASDSPYQIDGENTYEASISLIRDRIDFLSDGDRQALLTTTAAETFFGQ